MSQPNRKSTYGQPIRLPRVDPKYNPVHAARAYAPHALETLRRIVDGHFGAEPKDRIAAAKVILDRAYGAAPQSITLDVDSSMAEAAASLRAKMGAILAMADAIDPPTPAMLDVTPRPDAGPEADPLAQPQMGDNAEKPHYGKFEV